MTDETRKRILGEMQRIKNEVYNCAHCQALKGQYARLSELLPPEPVEANGYLYTFNPPKEYEELVARRLKELGL